MPTFRFCESCKNQVRTENFEDHQLICTNNIPSPDHDNEIDEACKNEKIQSAREDLPKSRMCDLSFNSSSCDAKFTMHQEKRGLEVIKCEENYFSVMQDLNEHKENMDAMCYYCGQKTTEEDLDFHLEACDLSLVSCKKCKLRIQRRYITHHLSEDCVKRTVYCEYCNSDSVADILQEHFDVCELIPVYCENKCGKELKRNELQQHLVEKCPKRLIDCGYCSLELEAQLLKEHHSECQKFPVSCPKVCGSAVARNDLENHLDEACFKMYSKCTYQEMSCSFEGFPVDLRKHLTEERDYHSQLMKDKISELANIVQSQKTIIDDFKIEFLKMEERLNRKESGEANCFLWKITKFSEKLESIKFDNAFYSDCFYDSKYGYKLQVQVYPNGLKDSRKDIFKDTLSIFIRICSGEYDSLLDWPFNKRVTFKLIDQGEEKNHVVYSLKGSKDNSFHKPEEGCCNSGRGNAKFVSHEKLKNGTYIRNDVIFIEITIEK